MSSKIPMIGKRFGKLLVTGEAGLSERGTYKYECLCDCGAVSIKNGTELRCGKTKSCGCLKGIGRNKKHGGSGTKLHIDWMEMKRRCVLSANNIKKYPYHAGKGIKVCDEWVDNFAVFRDWSMENGYEETLSLDRINNDGNYCPENCRWVNSQIQSLNKTMYSNNKTGHKGVYYLKNDNKYAVEIYLNNRTLSLGRYSDLEDAIKVRRKAEEKYLIPLLSNYSGQN